MNLFSPMSMLLLHPCASLTSIQSAPSVESDLPLMLSLVLRRWTSSMTASFALQTQSMR